MKKSIICLLLLAVCLALTACGGKSNNSAAEAEPTLEKWMAEHPEQLKGVQSADGYGFS